MTIIQAFTTEHAARATNVSERRIRYWDTRGILSPTLSRDLLPKSSHNRIYTFEDLVGLRAIADLRDTHNVPLQQLRNIGQWLNERYNRPWSSLRFHVRGTGRNAEVLFHDPDGGTTISATRKGQTTFAYELEPIARDIAQNIELLRQREPEQIGSIRQRRGVISNTPVIDGTRIPTKAIWDFHRAGYSVESIIDEYPRLTVLDVENAIRFEAERRTA